MNLSKWVLIFTDLGVEGNCFLQNKQTAEDMGDLREKVLARICLLIAMACIVLELRRIENKTETFAFQSFE